MLVKVEDPAGHTELYDFNDGVHQATKYEYDANGNMTKDWNKGIDVAYNYLNLATSVTWADGRKITWQYDATGAKLNMSVYGAGGTFTEAQSGHVMRRTSSWLCRDSASRTSSVAESRLKTLATIQLGCRRR
jgi:YD repeat-containing protein